MKQLRRVPCPYGRCCCIRGDAEEHALPCANHLSNGSPVRSHQRCSPRRPLLPESECVRSVSSSSHRCADRSRLDPVAQPNPQTLPVWLQYVAGQPYAIGYGSLSLSRVAAPDSSVVPVLRRLNDSPDRQHHIASELAEQHIELPPGPALARRWHRPGALPVPRSRAAQLQSLEVERRQELVC